MRHALLPRRLVVLGLALTTVGAACGSSTTAVRSVSSQAGTTVTASTSLPTTTVPDSTVPDSTAPTTDAPPTTTAGDPTTTVTGTPADPASLSDGDIARILAVVTTATAPGDASTEAIIVARLGNADRSGFVNYSGAPRMSTAQRQAIEQALAPVQITWLDDQPAKAPVLQRGQAQLFFSAPKIVEGRLAVAWGYTCGGLCGAGGFMAVIRDADGWVVTGPVGGGWIS